MKIVGVILVVSILTGCGCSHLDRRQVSASDPPAVPLRSGVFEDLSAYRRIVFIVDGGVSMINELPVMKDQIDKAVKTLRPDQSFNIIFFGDRHCESFSKELAPANAEKTRRVRPYLEDLPLMDTDLPVSAFELAFAEKADAIYLIENGDFPDNDLVLKTIGRLNEKRSANIYTVACLSEKNELDAASIGLFEKIAADSGGKFCQVNTGKLPTPRPRPAVFDDVPQFRRIVFLIDASESMKNKFAELRGELIKTVDGLSADQAFNVVPLTPAPFEPFAGSLQIATPAAKARFHGWVAGIQDFPARPIRGIEETFREKPDVIYVVTDRDFSENDAVLKRFRELNADHSAPVYGVGFFDRRDELFLRNFDTLETIVRESGGRSRGVWVENLNH